MERDLNAGTHATGALRVPIVVGGLAAKQRRAVALRDGAAAAHVQLRVELVDGAARRVAHVQHQLAAAIGFFRGLTIGIWCTVALDGPLCRDAQREHHRL